MLDGTDESDTDYVIDKLVRSVLLSVRSPDNHHVIFSFSFPRDESEFCQILINTQDIYKVCEYFKGIYILYDLLLQNVGIEGRHERMY